jgi:hypothetical protein
MQAGEAADEAMTDKESKNEGLACPNKIAIQAAEALRL